MDNEKYGIELELIVNKFKEKMQQVKNAFKGIDNKQVNITANTSQINYLKSQINDLTEKIKRIDKGFETGDVLKYEAQLEKVTNQYNKLISQQDTLQRKSNSSMSSMNKGFDKVMSKVRRFGLSLLGIRTIWSLISRASSAYLSQDTERANKLQAVWVGLGALLGPVIDKLSDILIKGVTYINIFVKALTGVDLLAKAVAKSMNNTTKSAKGLNRALAGFDELTNLDTQSDAGSGIDASWADAFNNVEIDTTWADRIREFGEWVKTNKETIISAFTGIAGAILMIKRGVEGIKALGIGLIIFGVVYAIQSLIDYLKSPTFENFGKIIQGIGVAITGLGIVILGIPTIIAGVVVLIVGTIMRNWDKIKEYLQKGMDWLSTVQENVTNWFINNIDKIKDKFGYLGVGIVGLVTGTFNWVVEIIKGAIGIVISVFDGLFTGIKQIFDGILMIFKGEFKNGFINIGKGIVNALIGILNGLISGINAIVYPIRSLIVGIGQVMGKNWTIQSISIPKIPSLDVGTNYVPEDQIAMLHKGETVVPKKFNSREYFGTGNEETNSKLDRVIEAIENIEINPYTTIKDVGKASLSYINNKSRQLGESVVV